MLDAMCCDDKNYKEQSQKCIVLNFGKLLRYGNRLLTYCYFLFSGKHYKLWNGSSKCR